MILDVGVISRFDVATNHLSEYTQYTKVMSYRQTTLESQPGINNGYNWKGDPNATMSGQSIPQLPPGSPPPAAEPAPPAVAAAEYDPATGTYLGPDGREYTRSDLAQNAPQNPTWQSMLTPPGS